MIRVENHDGRLVLEGASRIVLPTQQEGNRVIHWLEMVFS